MLQFAKTDKVDLTLNIKDMQGKLPENTKLQEEMSGSAYKVFRRIIRDLTQMKVTTPGKFKRCVFLTPPPLPYLLVFIIFPLIIIIIIIQLSSTASN